MLKSLPIGIQTFRKLVEGDCHEQFAELLFELAKQNRVVVLIDDYDKPIIDNLENLKEA